MGEGRMERVRAVDYDKTVKVSSEAQCVVLLMESCFQILS